MQCQCGRLAIYLGLQLGNALDALSRKGLVEEQNESAEYKADDTHGGVE